MNKRMTIVTTIAAVVASGAAFAQPAQTTSGGAMQTAMKLPAACQAAAQAGRQADMMQKMQTNMSENMQSMQDMVGQMTETQRGLHRAMMTMNGPMLTGMMAKDADVAWICAMIPHHQGAIDMARAGLKGADNAESKKMAEETISSQEKEIAKLTAWVEKNGQRESRNETGSTGTTR